MEELNTVLKAKNMIPGGGGAMFFLKKRLFKIMENI